MKVMNANGFLARYIFWLKMGEPVQVFMRKKCKNEISLGRRSTCTVITFVVILKTAKSSFIAA